MPTEEETQSPRSYTAVIVLGTAVVVTILLAFFTSKVGMGLLPQKLTVTAYYPDSAGLKPGASVNLDGVTIGTVKTVTVNGAPEHKKAPVEVVMRLNTKYQSSLHKDSLATLMSLGPLADTTIDVDSEHATGPPLQSGDVMKTPATPSAIDMKAGEDMVKSLKDLEGRLNTVFDQAESGKGSIGQALSNPSLANNVSESIDTVRDVTRKLNSNNNTVGKFLNDHSVTDNLQSVARDAQGVQDSFAKVQVGPVQASLTSAQTQANALIADVNAGKGSVGMLKDPAFAKQVNSTLAKANALVDGYNKNPATGGNFAAGGAIDVNLTKLQKDSNELVAAFRKNPKKYIAIEFRIF